RGIISQSGEFVIAGGMLLNGLFLDIYRLFGSGIILLSGKLTAAYPPSQLLAGIGAAHALLGGFPLARIGWLVHCRAILRNGFYFFSAQRRIRSGIVKIVELSNRHLHGREIEIGRRLMAFSALTRKSRSGISHSSESLIVEVIGGRRLI